MKLNEDMEEMPWIGREEKINHLDVPMLELKFDTIASI